MLVPRECAESLICVDERDLSFRAAGATLLPCLFGSGRHRAVLCAVRISDVIAIPTKNKDDR